MVVVIEARVASVQWGTAPWVRYDVELKKHGAAAATAFVDVPAAGTLSLYAPP